MFKALEELGELKFHDKEDGMAELKASVMPFASLAPLLVRTLGGAAANLAIRAIVDAFDDDDRPEATAAGVEKKLQEVNLRKIPEILARAEETLKELGVTGPELDPAPWPTIFLPEAQNRVIESPVGHGPAPSVPEPSPGVPPAVVVQPEKEGLGIVDRVFGGRLLAGLKTPMGILLYCVAWAFGPEALGYIPADIQSALFALATALAGIGLTAKLDKVLPWLATITAVIRPKK
jgi:hypothetical protein